MISDYFSPVSPKPSRSILFLCLTALILTFSYLVLSPTSLILSEYNLELQEFESFKLLHHKSYQDLSEDSKRFKIFRDNLSYIRVFNSLNNDWTLGVNYFTDLTPSEFRALYTQKLELPAISSASTQQHLSAIPNSINWATKGNVPGVINQGASGNVLSIAVAETVGSAWSIAGHNLVPLSYPELADCVSNFFSFADGYNFVKSNGLTSLAIYPAQTGTCNRSKVAQPVAKISSYVNVTPNNSTLLVNAIALGTVAVGVDAGTAFQSYSGGIITKNCGTNIDHALIAVGYDLTGSVPYYIVQNSWGTSWGMQGFAQIAITAGAGTCGIQSIPTYPVV